MSLQVTKIDIMRMVDWACLLVIKGSNVAQSCLTKSRNLIKFGNQKLTNAVTFLVSASIFAGQMTYKGLLFLCLSVKNIIRKVYDSILASIRTLGQSVKSIIRKVYDSTLASIRILGDSVKNIILNVYDSILASIRTLDQFVKKFINAMVKTIAYPFTSFHAFLKQSAKAFRTTCTSYATSSQSSISNVRESLRSQFSSLKAHFSYGNALAVLQRPVVVLPLAFPIIAFVGARIYDGQISKVEDMRAALAAKHEKDLPKQKHYVLHGYENENVASKRKRTREDRAFAQASPSRSIGYTDLQKAVDSFFHSHRVSEVTCDKHSCKIKVDDRIIDGSGPINAESTVFISEANGDHIVFADASGNRYVESIDSLFDEWPFFQIFLLFLPEHLLST